MRSSLEGARRFEVRSIKNRLALLFFSITFAAIAVVYSYVAPTLGSSLRTQKMHSLAIAAKAYSRALTRTANLRHSNQRVALAVRHAAALSSDRVTLLGVGADSDKTKMFYVYDSSSEAPGTRGGSGLHFDIAVEAARSHRLETATETGTGGPVAEAAKPLLQRPGGGGRCFLRNALRC